MSAEATQAEFGITISCWRGDRLFLKGCLNSIRKYLPDTPICLIKHGAFPTEKLCDLYGAVTLEQADVDPRLRERSYGYGLTKMVAFWHSPFGRFAHIDPDAVLWGNILDGVPWRDYDLIYNEAHEKITPYIQRTQYFNPDLVFPSLPEFAWKGQPFFNTGVFTARRGVFDLDEYIEILRFKDKVPGSFFTDQGPLNFMAFRQISEGRLRTRDWPFQAIVPVLSSEELTRRFRFENSAPVVENDRRLIHWAGLKPLVTRPSKFDAPMIFFRLQHLRSARSWSWRLGRIALALEEIINRYTARHGGSYVKAALAKAKYLLHRLRGRLIPA